MKKMKLVLMGLAVCAMPFLAEANSGGGKNMPRPVSSAFTRQYPGAHLMNWQERNNEYVVNFRSSTENSSAYYTKDGVWLRTDTKLSGKQDLPENVQDGLARSTYAKYNVEEVDQVRQPAGKTVYMLRVDYGADAGNDYLLYFNADGRLENARRAPGQPSEEQ
ncbi:MAG TPA: PepSY-like domain-containing protein [Puia sp.]|nr:PepSY-like domain-containing protein [Puia sp.]